MSILNANFSVVVNPSGSAQITHTRIPLRYHSDISDIFNKRPVHKMDTWDTLKFEFIENSTQSTSNFYVRDGYHVSGTDNLEHLALVRVYEMIPGYPSKKTATYHIYFRTIKKNNKVVKRELLYMTGLDACKQQFKIAVFECDDPKCDKCKPKET